MTIYISFGNSPKYFVFSILK